MEWVGVFKGTLEQVVVAAVMLTLAHTYPAGQGKHALTEEAPENG